VLRGLNLKVSSGQKLALVGASGSGKSSVIALIQRLYEAESGEVRPEGRGGDELGERFTSPGSIVPLNIL
jgi:ABC-type transport system involved in cytochrome bd biosynthesis fused ATPase/permease subunit